MKNYYFNAEGAYTGSAPAQPGTIAPENAIRLPPPEKEGYWPVVRPARDGWELAEDHRGREGWLDGRMTVVAFLGPLPEGWSDTPPEESDGGEPADAEALLFLTRSGIYHRDGCSHTRAVGQWLTRAGIASAKPSARPCARCRPATPGVEGGTK